MSLSDRLEKQKDFTVVETSSWETVPPLQKESIPLLVVQNLSKRFENRDLWKNVSFTLHAGETVSICGASGSGKSTLLFAIGGLETVQGGSIVFQGKPIIGGRKASIQGIGYIFQQYHLIEELTVQENIQYPLWIQTRTKEAPKDWEEIIEMLGLASLLDRLPMYLSGGEQQRVVIARTLFTQPKLLLADEPTGSLDEATGARVMELLLKTCRSMHTSLLLVTHSVSFAKQTDRQMILKGGNLYEP